MIDSQLKQAVLQALQETLSQSIAQKKRLIHDAQTASSEDTKSSAGDKFETSREMMAQEIRKLDAQLDITNSQQVLLLKLTSVNRQDQVVSGSLIQTNQGWYFLGIPVGKIVVHDIPIFCLSLASPLGQVLLGKKASESFSFREKEFVIERLA